MWPTSATSAWPAATWPQRDVCDGVQGFTGGPEVQRRPGPADCETSADDGVGGGAGIFQAFSTRPRHPHLSFGTGVTALQLHNFLSHSSKEFIAHAIELAEGIHTPLRIVRV